MENNKIYCKRIKHLLKCNGLSQIELARMADLTQTAISAYVNGERVPNALSLVKIATALNTSTDYLLGVERKNKQRKFTVYAVDFDGTLCESKYPGIGKPNKLLIDFLKTEREIGHKLILWTCRSGERLDEAVAWCESHGLTFDAVNKNLPELIEQFGNDCRKVAADIYIDDKSMNKLVFHLPYSARKV